MKKLLSILSLALLVSSSVPVVACKKLDKVVEYARTAVVFPFNIEIFQWGWMSDGWINNKGKIMVLGVNNVVKLAALATAGFGIKKAVDYFKNRNKKNATEVVNNEVASEVENNDEVTEVTAEETA